MVREDFLNLNIDEQIDFFYSELRRGSSITKISKTLGISRSITSKFKKHGYECKEQ